MRLLIAVTLVAVTLTACGSGPEDYTCADVRASSEKTREVVALLEEVGADTLGYGATPGEAVEDVCTDDVLDAYANTPTLKPDDSVYEELRR